MSVQPCTHNVKDHFFQSPFCENLQLLEKIVIVVFNVLTLGIPLLIFHVVSCIFPRKAQVQKAEFEGLKTIPPYFQLGKEALAFARKKLEEFPHIQPEKFRTEPVNPEIAKLSGIYHQISDKKFEEALKKYGENAWDQPEVLEATDECMKLAYAISCLTLDDVFAYTEKEANEKGKKPTFFEVLLHRQSGYQFKTFYYCTSFYHQVRSKLLYGKVPGSGHMDFYRDRDIPDAYAQRFYTPNAVQNKWNTLYNNFCDRVRLFVGHERDMQSEHTRYVKWTTKDTGVKTFRTAPTTV